MGGFQAFHRHDSGHHAPGGPQVGRRTVLFHVALHEPVVDLVVGQSIVIDLDADHANRVGVSGGQRLVVAHARAHDHLIEHAQLAHLLEHWGEARAGPTDDQHVRPGVQQLVDVGREVGRLQRRVNRAAAVGRVVGRELTAAAGHDGIERAGRTDAEGIVGRDLHEGVAHFQ